MKVHVLSFSHGQRSEIMKYYYEHLVKSRENMLKLILLQLVFFLCALSDKTCCTQALCGICSYKKCH